MAASLGLWLDADELGGESYAVHQDVKINMDRMHYDQDYCNLISEYIRRSIQYLAVELEELDKLSSGI